MKKIRQEEGRAKCSETNGVEHRKGKIEEDAKISERHNNQKEKDDITYSQDDEFCINE